MIYKTFLVLILSFINFINVSSQSIELLKVEQDIISGLEKYINDYENQINKLRSNLEELKKEHEEADEDVTRYLSNPINAYLLTKRLTTDWKHVEQMISSEQHLEFFKNISSSFGAEKLPSEEDLRNEILRLDRLRKTYNLPIAEVANGYLDGVRYSEPLDANDCFEIGRQLYHSEDWESSNDWLALAIKKLNYSSYHSSSEADSVKAQILDYYSMTQYKLGNFQIALNLAAEALKLNPDFDHIRENVKQIRRSMLEDRTLRTTAGSPKRNLKQKSEDEAKYEMGCRGKQLKTDKEMSKLYCEYFHGNFFNMPAFLKIAPFKVEILHRRPKIVLIHDFLYDNEIDKFMNMTEGNMMTADLVEQFKGVDVAYPTRSSKYFNIKDEDEDFVENFEQRMIDISGLNVKAAGEHIMISNYDVGSDFNTPSDYLFKIGEKPVSNSQELGNRIGTAIVYLNEVEKGGSIVFPKIDTVVVPTKGAALMWYNTLQNGEVDSDVQYAGCPVLKGSKWIITKHIREKDQVFNKPCTLNEEDRFEQDPL